MITVPGMTSLVPKEHIFYKVNSILKTSWSRKEVRELYCETNGRPSIDPEYALRLMLAGFLHGIKHDRKLFREAQVKKPKKEKRSKPDPDASFSRTNKRQRYKIGYKQHTVVDNKAGVVVDVHLTTGKTNDSTQLLEQIQQVARNTGVMPKTRTASVAHLKINVFHQAVAHVQYLLCMDTLHC
ncbi:transposase [bacterium]|nr:transposase [bacterium]